MFDVPNFAIDSGNLVTEFTLADDERLVGIALGGRGLNTAAFCDFQFIIGKPNKVIKVSGTKCLCCKRS